MRISDTKSLKLSKRQKETIKLYLRAYGECVVWSKNGKAKIIPTDEVVRVVEL